MYDVNCFLSHKSESHNSSMFGVPRPSHPSESVTSFLDFVYFPQYNKIYIVLKLLIFIWIIKCDCYAKCGIRFNFFV